MSLWMASLAEWLASPTVGGLLAASTVVGCLVGIGALIDARRSRDRFDGLHSEFEKLRSEMHDRIAAAVVKGIGAVLGDKGEGVVTPTPIPAALPEEQYVAAARVRKRMPSTLMMKELPPGVEAVGELEAARGGERPLMLFQNQTATGADLVILRWEGFDLILDSRVANRTGASFEVVDVDDKAIILTTIDYVNVGEVARIEIAVTAGSPPTYTPLDVSPADLKRLFDMPSWANAEEG